MYKRQANEFIQNISLRCNTPAKVYALCEDSDRLKRILSDDLYSKWATISADSTYFIDIGISCCGNIQLPDRPSRTKQETDEGTEVNAGDTVKVYISIGTGIKQVVVTSVLQKDVETAKKSLEEKGLVVEIEYTEDKTKDNGVVLNQSIKSGETVDEGSTITLTVNKIAETKTGTVTIRQIRVIVHPGMPA